MEATKSFRGLMVWQEAHKFVLQVYVQTKQFPKEELFGLTSQFRRAAVSIAANIAEGYPKRGKSDKLRFSKYFTRFFGGVSLLHHSFA
jgi:four helix bundle protein